MAAASSTASDHAPSGPQGPIRTCIGCRSRAVVTELLRVVAAAGAQVVPDPRRRMPGRGAWVHPYRQCVELATRRRAFARALHMPGAVDPTPVCEYVARNPQEMSS